MNAFGRVFAVVTRAFGAIALLAGIYLLGVAGWLTLHGQMDWSRNFRGLIMACAFVAVGILGLKGRCIADSLRSNAVGGLRKATNRLFARAPSNNRWSGP
jgi:hypothetical protein